MCNGESNVNYQILLKYDYMVARMYYYRAVKLLPWKVIYKYSGMTEWQCKELYRQGLSKLKNKDTIWMTGLSNALQNILMRHGYRSLEGLYKDLKEEKFDLSRLEGIGEKYAPEIESFVERKMNA